MKVKELIEKLKEYNQEAEVITITVGSRDEWDYTSEPKIKTSENMFGEKVWIQ